MPDWTSDTGEMKHVGRNYLASMGIYIFNKQLLFDLLEKEHTKATDFGKEIIPEKNCFQPCKNAPTRKDQWHHT